MLAQVDLGRRPGALQHHDVVLRGQPAIARHRGRKELFHPIKAIVGGLTCPQTLPSTITCEPVSDEGLISTGFISARAVAARLGLQSLARPISRPSGVAAEFSDMFCALNGATQ